jgi:hypothetical protein
MKSLLFKSVLSGVFLLCVATTWGQEEETLTMFEQSINTHLSDGNCEKAESAYESWKKYTDSSDVSIELRIAECKSESERKTPQDAEPPQQETRPEWTGKRIRSSAFYSEKHSYLAWGVLETGYPLMLGTNFMGRHGRNIGIGYSLSAGVDFGFADGPTYSPFHYSFGLKFFPYKDIFIMAGYGTLGCEEVSRFNDSEGRWALDGTRQKKGYSFMAGYDILGDLSDGWSGLCSISAGISYDTFMGKWNPLIKVKFGMAWGLE